jgi:hypothetical protein
MRRDARYLRGWDDPRPGKLRKFLAVLAFAGAAAGGYAAGDWMSSAKAERQSVEAVEKARRQLGAAVCVEHFMRQPDAEAQLTRLLHAGVKERGERIARGGWATMPDAQGPDPGLAVLCAARLGELYTSVRKATPISAHQR